MYNISKKLKPPNLGTAKKEVKQKSGKDSYKKINRFTNKKILLFNLWIKYFTFWNVPGTPGIC